MLTKTTTIFLMAFIAASKGADVWNGLVASWDNGSSSKFYKLPQTMQEAQRAGWIAVDGVGLPVGISALGYRRDPAFVLLFQLGRVVGFQVAVRVEDVLKRGQPLKYDKIDAFMAKQLNGNNVYYTSTVYFSNNRSKGIRKITIYEKNRVFEVPTRVSEVRSKTAFALKKCVPTIGTHYSTWNRRSNCATLYPWNLVGIGNNIIGLSFQAFGTPRNTGIRTWWDSNPRDILNRAIPDQPTCALNAAKKIGLFSLHIWFVAEPQKITCS